MLVGEGGLDVRFDVPYGSHPRHKLDVYAPKRPRAGQPVALFLYGGSWRGGCRSCYGFVGAALAARGITTAVADYRLYPEVRWPGFQNDAAAAFRWVRRELVQDGASPVTVIGHSAGAHMAALLALDQRWLGEDRPDGVVGLSGPYSFQPTVWPTTREIFATASDPDEPRPVAYGSSSAPPTLLLHGSADDTVKPHNMLELADVLRRFGAPIEARLLTGADHKATVLGFARPLRRKFPVLDLTVAFITGIKCVKSATSA